MKSLVGGFFHGNDRVRRKRLDVYGDARSGIAGAWRASHQGGQLVFFLIVNKQFFHQRWLVVEHVDQETQGPQVVAQLLVGSCCAHLLIIDLGAEHLLDSALHLQNSPGSLVKAQHRQDAAHLRQLPRHRLQRALVLRIAKEQIKRAFNLGQRDAQFAHHAAHGLLVADPAVQLLHPSFERLGRPAVDDAFKPLGQTGGPDRQLRIGRIQVIEHGFKIKHGSRDFHCQRNIGHLLSVCRGFNGLGQGLRKWFTGGMKFSQRISHQAELVGYLLDFCAFTRAQRRPGILGQNDALARLCQQCGVKAAKLNQFIVHGLETGQAIGKAHRRKHRRVTGTARHCLKAKEQQVQHQPLRDGSLASGQGGVLQQDSGSGAPDVKVGAQQVVGNGLEKPGGKQPENPRLLLGLTRCKSEAQIPQAGGGLRGLAFHQLQNGLVEHFTRIVAVGMRLGHWRHFRLKPTPLVGPQIGRMNAVGSHKLLNVAVLRKQGHGRKGLIGQYAFEILG